MHSISDLTTFCRKTTGDVPSKLVVCLLFPFRTQYLLTLGQGGSTTVVGSKMYLFVCALHFCTLAMRRHLHREAVWLQNVE
jgi:hypothetical protein